MSEASLPPSGARQDRGFTVARSLDVPAAISGAIAAIGNFDGLHRGHRAVIARAEAMGRALSAPVVLLTFEPHPRSFFRPDTPLFRLTPEPVKLAVARALGLDGAVVLPFDATLAATSASQFVRDILAGRLGLRGVAVGHDFHFGRGREGSPAFIAREGEQLGLAVDVIAPLVQDGAPVSSSAIRTALSDGDVETAARLIGSRWLVRGTVQHGDKRGRTLGFPTANIRLSPDCALRHGIYAVRLAIDGVVHDGVASFGRRPTFDDGAPLLEVFVFDFAGSLYDKTLDVEFCAWIRGEEKFDGIETLIARMTIDCEQARTALARGAEIPAPSLLPLAG
ncbi:bifunctional riboflavin kinase/FAD synthetase [uncultured Alsobacter sp.]|uniref:bifunctional riboflavin kinase/FAD synthetase n=1 Tax=uncultured Alsobacter sp. TaxID=1748258 RepID=UPI0025DDB848|nr:bifunctional riboflavin kinase/FAD synthetase [uncultured Alsobacter sp.]